MFDIIFAAFVVAFCTVHRLGCGTSTLLTVAFDSVCALLGLFVGVALLRLAFNDASPAAPAFGAVVAAAYATWLVVEQCRDRRATSPPRAARRPLSIVVHNVLFDNATPASCAQQLLDADADLIVVVEATREFFASFDALNGAAAYRHRVGDCLPSRGDEPFNGYAVMLVSRVPLVSDATALRTLSRACDDVVGGDLTVVCATPCLAPSLVIVATNLHALVDAPYAARWHRQWQLLSDFVSSLSSSSWSLSSLSLSSPSMLVVGDLNTTAFRPEFR